MITVDGVELNESMIWRDRYQSAGVAQTMKRTLGGVPVVRSGSYEKGVPITLEAADDIGWLTRTMVEEMRTRAAVPGASYVLNFGGTNYTVIFRNHEPPAVDMQPVYPRTADESGDYFRGVLKFMTV